ncbi:MAG TPA: helix-turn-helix domain-containing protein [Microbacterium sp.]|jgi:AcrR family transcriptional regulator|nr:helix-turn-helix domain-containing protein [Microbacterium sp.]
MHFVTNSASTLRDRRAAETSLGLRTEARRLTAERGLTGFTIEEVCSEVGVSRRTFFNYYASKENAVLGIPVRSDASDLEEAFLTGSGNLVDDLAELHIARWERLALTRAEAEEMGRIFEREPRLFAHFISLNAEGEREDIALVRRRPDAPADDIRLATLVQVFGALLRPAIFEYFADDRQPFRALLLRRLDATRSIFSL